MKSERKFANDVTISVPRSVLKDNDEKSKPTKKGRMHLSRARIITAKDLSDLFPF